MKHKNSVNRANEVYRIVEQRFIELWGDMSSWWGVSRTMAEIHGLLFITSTPHSAEDIQNHLGISRGNVSMNIRTLVEWGLVRRVRKRGDRRDYYESLTDVWEMFTVLASQRKRREIDPIVKTLKQCRTDLDNLEQPKNDANRPEHHVQRVDELLGFLLTVEKVAEHFFKNNEGLREAMELLAHTEE
ncbi:MAG: MarR family transcriptional regulator [Planctomycetia bacterium]|nr:MarR family transcriptional regulator [Planctomycetia bacterium]